jgi:hypothetical protein
MIVRTLLAKHVYLQPLATVCAARIDRGQCVVEEVACECSLIGSRWLRNSVRER